MSADLCFLPIRSAGALLRARKVSPVELVQAFLHRIDAVDAKLNSYITVVGEQALAQARSAEAEIYKGAYKGLLHGIPYGLKDIFLTSGVRTTACSQVLLDNVPDRDSHVHAKLKQAGAILLGKLNTFEFGMGVGAVSTDLPFPPARNPWNLDHFTGSTSTGAGAAVAAGTAMAAFGTDTGGSVRLPAAACGMVGVKPTYGRVSRRNIIPNAWSLDHVGSITRTIDDAAILLQSSAGFDPDDPTSVECDVPEFSARMTNGLRGLRIGVIRRFHTRDVVASQNVASAIDKAIDVMHQLGAEIVSDEPSAGLHDYRACMKIINSCESYAAHRKMFREEYGRLGVGFREKMMAGMAVSAADYIDAQRWRQQLAKELSELIGRYDAIVCAGTMNPAPNLQDKQAVVNFTGTSAMAAFNLSGHPALSICTGYDAAGLPLNMQIAATHYNEAMLFRVAAAYETHTSWHSRRPRI